MMSATDIFKQDPMSLAPATSVGGGAIVPQAIVLRVRGLMIATAIILFLMGSTPAAPGVPEFV